MTPAIESIFIDNIVVPPGRRPVDPKQVESIAASMADIGLRTPITVRSPDESEVILVAGAHRLAAAKSLGWDMIDCFVLSCDEVQAEMWEISENLHRAELTALQRSEQIGRWVELKGMISRQVGAKPGRPASGARKAARELNIPEQDARRSVSISGLTKEAKQAAVDAGMDDNQSALLEAARQAPERQASYIQERATRPPSNYPQDDFERSIKWRRAFERIWNDAPSAADREWAQDWIDKPIMDAA